MQKELFIFFSYLEGSFFLLEIFLPQGLINKEIRFLFRIAVFEVRFGCKFAKNELINIFHLFFEFKVY